MVYLLKMVDLSIAMLVITRWYITLFHGVCALRSLRMEVKNLYSKKILLLLRVDNPPVSMQTGALNPFKKKKHPEIPMGAHG